MEHLLGAQQVDRVVILAFDQYHRTDGTCLGAPRRGRTLWHRPVRVEYIRS